MYVTKQKTKNNINPPHERRVFYWNIMASYYNNETVLYLKGEFVKASEAKMDFYSQSLQYCYSVFEGIRSYKTVNSETKIFKAKEHFDRLKN